jgi:hypothetical protein
MIISQLGDFTRGASDYKCECKKRSKMHQAAESVLIGLAITERVPSLFMFAKVADRSVGAAVTARHSKVKVNARVNNMATRSLMSIREGCGTTSV